MQFIQTLNGSLIPEHSVFSIGVRIDPQGSVACRHCEFGAKAHHHVTDVLHGEHAASAQEVARFRKACEVGSDKPSGYKREAA